MFAVHFPLALVMAACDKAHGSTSGETFFLSCLLLSQMSESGF